MADYAAGVGLDPELEFDRGREPGAGGRRPTRKRPSIDFLLTLPLEHAQHGRRRDGPGPQGSGKRVLFPPRSIPFRHRRVPVSARRRARGRLQPRPVPATGAIVPRLVRDCRAPNRARICRASRRLAARQDV